MTEEEAKLIRYNVRSLLGHARSFRDLRILPLKGTLSVHAENEVTPSQELMEALQTEMNMALDSFERDIIKPLEEALADAEKSMMQEGEAQ